MRKNYNIYKRHIHILHFNITPIVEAAFLQNHHLYQNQESYSPLFPGTVHTFAVFAMVRFAPFTSQSMNTPFNFCQIQDTHTDWMPLVYVYHHPKEKDDKTSRNFMFCVLNTDGNHSLFGTTSCEFTLLYFCSLHQFSCNSQFLIHPDWLMLPTPSHSYFTFWE